MSKKTLNIIVICVLCYGTMVLGALFTQVSVKDWYPTLNIPAWSPPNWSFRIVWPILYTCMAISAFLIQRKQAYRLENSSFIWFVIQLFFNVVWSFLFFVLKSPALAFVDILLLFFSLSITILNFARISAAAGWLLFPYFIWVIYASALNLFIWFTNA